MNRMGPVDQKRDEVGRHRTALSNAECVRLLSIANAGDAAAENLVFEYLRRRLIPLARQALRTSDVEDLVQDVLVIIHSKYRALVARCKLQDGAGFERWWRRILYNCIGNDIRRRRFECGRCVPADHLLTLAAMDAPDRRCEASELRDVILRALRHLNASQRSFLMREAMTTRREPAASRHRNARYAKLYRARKALRQAIREEGGCFLVKTVCLVCASVS